MQSQVMQNNSFMIQAGSVITNNYGNELCSRVSALGLFDLFGVPNTWQELAMSTQVRPPTSAELRPVA